LAKTHALDAQVIIIGGGHAGLSLTALLAAHGISCLCVDRGDAASAKDTRTTAISYGSQRVVAAAGAWDAARLNPCAIRDIQILDGNSPVLLDFLSHDIGGDMFGWIVQNNDLRNCLLDRLAALPLATLLAPAQISDLSLEEDSACVHLADGRILRAQLVIGADGKNSFTRQWMNIPVRHWSYHQQAIVCVITHEKPHDHIAIEHFMDEGPFAVLPMADDDNGAHRSALVWTEHTNRDGRLTWDDHTFISALSARLPEFYGAVLHVTPRAAWPLSLTHAYQYIGPRMALVADAAHAIHPIAGQGLNLGLRDIAVMAELLVEAQRNQQDMGAPDLLEEYQRRRRFDNMLMAAATDNLNRLFSHKSKLLGLARKAGLKLVQKSPGARSFLMRQAMAAPDAKWLPKLIRDGSLS